jgi:capsular exopolysaccharide synthesis family protein
MSAEHLTNTEEFRLPLELKTVLKTLRLKFWWIVFLFVIACGLGIGGALLLGTQMFESTTVLFYQPIDSYVPDTFRIYQSVGEGTELSYEQGAGLIKFEASNTSLWNRVNMVKTRPNLEELRKRLKLEKTLDQLGSSIDVYVAQDTNLMFIAAKSEKGEEAQNIANTIRDIFLETNDMRIGGELKEQLAGLQQQYDATSKELLQAQTRFSDFIGMYNIRDIKTQTTIYATELAGLELSIQKNKEQIEIYQQRILRVKQEIQSVGQAELDRQEALSKQPTKPGITTDEATNRIKQITDKIEALRSETTDPIELNRLKTNLTIAENAYVRGLISRSEFETASYDYQLFKAKTSKTEEIELLKQEIEEIRSLPHIGLEENANTNEYLQQVKLVLLENELELIRLELQYASDKQRYESLNSNFIDMPTIKQTYDSLNGNVISLEAENRGLEKILNQYTTISGKSQSDFSIISDAAIPLLPMESNKKLIAVVIAFLVFLLGFVIILISIITDTRIKSSADAKQKLNMAVIGAFPYQRNTASLTPTERDESSQIELYRILARPLRLKYPKPGATILVTSTAKGEGKSTTVINLATVFGRQDEHVLVIDAQIRYTEKPSPFHTYCIKDSLGTHHKGLGEYLSYKVASWEEIISQTVLPGVDIILKNEEAIIPDLLQSARMSELMQELKQQYSIIIVEGAPVGECVDSEILTNYSDTILFVTACDMLRPTVIQKALTRIKNTNIPLEGVILTKIRSVYAE